MSISQLYILLSCCFAALAVRFVTKRYLHEYDPKLGKFILMHLDSLRATKVIEVLASSMIKQCNKCRHCTLCFHISNFSPSISILNFSDSEPRIIPNGSLFSKEFTPTVYLLLKVKGIHINLC